MSKTRSTNNNDSKQLGLQNQPPASSMTSSESKVEETNGFNLDIWHGESKVLEEMILDYSFEAKRLEEPKTRFWTPSLKQEILSLAYHAAPLDHIELYVRKARARDEKHLRETLVEATVEAIKNGDVTLTDEKGHALKDKEGHIIAEGMAEKLMELHDALYPGEKCIDIVRPKLSPVEDEKEKKDREEANIAAITQVFNAIRLNDHKTDAAIENFQAWATHATPFNRIHMLFVAFDILARRGGELPSINAEDEGQWRGKLADRFCFEVIGAGIEKDLPPRMQQLLKTGLYYILNSDQVVARDLDVNSLKFHGAGSARGLGIDFYYDDIGRGCTDEVLLSARWELVGGARFNTYYEHLQQHSHIMQQPSHHSELSLI